MTDELPVQGRCLTRLTGARFSWSVVSRAGGGLLIDGIRVGAPWRDVADRYGSWAAVYGLFRRWQRDGTWARVLNALQALADAGGRITWEVFVDS